MRKDRQYKSYDDLPLTLNASDVADILGISRAMAYQLLHSSCPVARFGKRMVVPRNLFLNWLEKQTRT